MNHSLTKTRILVIFISLLVLISLVVVQKTSYAQSRLNDSSKSEKRLKKLERYQETFDQYSPLKGEFPKKAVEEFRSFLSIATVRSEKCLQQTDPETRAQCKRELKADYNTAKKFNRILKYYLIEEGNPNVCVKANLGVEKELVARGINPAIVKRIEADKAAGKEVNPKETGRSEKSDVYLCTGDDGKKKLRIQDDSGTLLRLSPEDEVRADLQIPNVPPAGNLDILIKKLGLITGEGSITASPNPCSGESCNTVTLEWDVTDQTPDPVQVKNAAGTALDSGRNGKTTIQNPASGEVFNLYARDKLLGSVEIKTN